MIKANYHTHSCYCDGKESLRRYVETAVERGFTHLGFSGHAPVPFENTFAIDGERYLDYCAEVRRLKVEFADRLKIFLGLEIDYIPGALVVLLIFPLSYQFDLLIYYRHLQMFLHF